MQVRTPHMSHLSRGAKLSSHIALTAWGCPPATNSELNPRSFSRCLSFYFSPTSILPSASLARDVETCEELQGMHWRDPLLSVHLLLSSRYIQSSISHVALSSQYIHSRLSATSPALFLPDTDLILALGLHQSENLDLSTPTNRKRQALNRTSYLVD